MDRFPIFRKETYKLRQPDLMKNIWCPHYDDCLDNAAERNSLLDCSQCNNSTINFEDDWRNRNIYCLL